MPSLDRYLLLAALLCAAVSGYAETLTGKVVGVSDGDTIIILSPQTEQHKIRVATIDAPEKAQPYGQRAKQQMSDLVFGQMASVEWNKRDRYRRIIGKVIVSDQDAGLALLTAGLAWHYRKYQAEQSPEDRERYAEAEAAAREKRLGLWADVNPVHPWEWRAKKRESE